MTEALQISKVDRTTVIEELTLGAAMVACMALGWLTLPWLMLVWIFETALLSITAALFFPVDGRLKQLRSAGSHLAGCGLSAIVVIDLSEPGPLDQTDLIVLASLALARLALTLLQARRGTELRHTWSHLVDTRASLVLISVIVGLIFCYLKRWLYDWLPPTALETVLGLLLVTVNIAIALAGSALGAKVPAPLGEKNGQAVSD